MPETLFHQLAAPFYWKRYQAEAKAKRLSENLP